MFKESKWIWNKDAGELNSFADFLVEFDVVCGKEYVFYVSSCCNHMIKLNGEYIPCSQREGFENDPEYQILNITDKVTCGKNTIVVTVYSQGIDSFVWRKRPAGLIYSLLENNKVISASTENTPSRVCTTFKQGEME